MVRFGLFLNCGAQIGRSDDEVFDLVLEEARLAERLGYHDVWVTEHHFIPFGINPSALTLAAFILGQTSRLRVGTAVTLAPLYHPLQLAEQAALLDQCSGGRLDFGIGRGGYLAEFDAFGIDPARWTDEVELTASVLLDAWRKKEVSAQSRWATFAPVSVNPRPRTKPHPPLFLASTTPSTVAFAAANKLPLLHYWGTPLEARIATERLYAEAASGPVDHVHALVVVVADDEASTRAALAERLKQSFRDGDWPHVPQARNRHVGPDGQPIAREKLAEFVAQHALVGPPDRICQRLQEIRTKLGAQRFVLFMEAIADRKSILSSIERFAREVMPHFATGRLASDAALEPASVAS
jgi:alkanesulfonate monooxygenase SsuD/methylene tetrahydromethanopterin reductase-like flavin-dependent oxidoreductase (luciferase family)